ncbi:hypothetical protein ATJ97_2503 [Georgenia soli]|uniref:VOC domain-containing protein n=1 Tax=Georgenia soli TaxID=638953 RepID=A0A2A9EMF2_9MICO|nr:hypothetical protein [Georgenia soli]PFG39983.1 hypothetical protein ATJ97_2503 [Georgenia soli]
MTAWTGPTPTVRPIQFVTDLPTWRRFYTDLGLVGTGEDADGWTVLAAPSGRVALHAAARGGPLEGRTKLGLEVDDLGAYRDAVEAAGLPARPVTLGHGSALEVRVPGIGSVVVDRRQTPAGAAPVTPAVLSVVGLVHTEAVLEGAAAASRLGFRRRITSDGGGWADLVGHGILGLHAGEATTVDGTTACEISLEVGDLAPLLGKVTESGLQAHLIDEAYGRTLRVTMPDGSELWVNETQRDLYGYHVEEETQETR